MTTCFEGFESQVGEHNTWKVFPMQGGVHLPPEMRQIGNCYVPAGWMGWFVHEPGVLDQPETHFTAESRRVRSGTKAWQCFWFGRNGRGGLFRSVPTKPGQKVRVTAHAHAWSNGYKDSPHPNDGKWSEWAGYEETRITYNEALKLGGTQQLDAARNIRFRVLLDPAGTEDIWTPTMVMDADGGQCVYNDYQEPAITNECIATGEQVTVWLLARTYWPFTHNDVYWDDVTIEVISAEPEPPTCENPARAPYDRTYVLLPQDATLAEICAAAAKYPGKTIGQSADDAGIGCGLASRHVIAIRPDAWPTDLRAFFEEWYPGLTYEVGNLGPEQIKLTYPVTYMPPTVTQHFSATHRGLDLRASWAQWGTEALAALPGTVVEAGWVYNTLGYNVLVRTSLPGNVTVDCRYAHLLSDLYVKVGDMVQAGHKLGKCDGSASPAVADHLHFSVAVNGVYVDPEPLIEWPEEPVPPIPPQPVIYPTISTIHCQTMEAGWQQFTTQAKPRMIKVFNFQDVYGPTGAYPDIEVVVRSYKPDPASPDDPVAAAKWWYDQIKDDIRATADEVQRRWPNHPLPLFRVETFNEKISSSDTPTLQKWVRCYVECSKLLHSQQPRVSCCMGHLPVGNPREFEWALLEPMAEIAVANNDWLDYHGYWGANPGATYLDNELGYLLAWRWMLIDDEFAKHGLKPHWYCGETGAVGIVLNPDGSINTLLPYDGWRSPKTENGDWPRYRGEILHANQIAVDWNRTHGDRFHGLCLFTIAAHFITEWDNYKLKEPEMLDLAAVLAH